MYVYSIVGAFDTPIHCSTNINTDICTELVYVHNHIWFIVYCSAI